MRFGSPRIVHESLMMATSLSYLTILITITHARRTAHCVPPRTLYLYSVPSTPFAPGFNYSFRERKRTCVRPGIGKSFRAKLALRAATRESAFIMVLLRILKYYHESAFPFSFPVIIFHKYRQITRVSIYRLYTHISTLYNRDISILIQSSL